MAEKWVQERKRQIVIGLREKDFDFRVPLARAAAAVDRTPSHLARQIIMARPFKLGELSSTTKDDMADR